MPERRIERLSWDEVAARLTPERLVIVPIGAHAKEHGLHLPMNTDAITAQTMIEAAERSIALRTEPGEDRPGRTDAQRDGSLHDRPMGELLVVRQTIIAARALHR